jgi:hypothetical protein
MYKTIALLSILVLNCYANAQQNMLLSANGASRNTMGPAISWSIGEPVVGSSVNGRFIITQGFQQPYISKYFYLPPSDRFTFYPNPVQNILYIMIPDNVFMLSETTVSDINGKRIRKIKNTEIPTKIDMNGVDAGVYFVTIATNSGKTIKTGKVIKL